MRFGPALAVGLAALAAGAADAAALPQRSNLQRRALSFSGVDGTAYFPGTGGLGVWGACGTQLSTAQYPGACAISDQLFDATKNGDWKSSLCGQCVRVCGDAGCGYCQILDRCEGCGYGHIDMTYETFRRAVGETPTRRPVTWTVVDCSSVGQTGAPAEAPGASAAAASAPAPVGPSAAPVGTTDLGGSAFTCLPADSHGAAVLTPLKVTAGNEIACLSADSTHCLFATTFEQCLELARTATTYSPYLECGHRHAEVYGGDTGYSSPDSWCSRGRGALIGH